MGLCVFKELPPNGNAQLEVKGKDQYLSQDVTLSQLKHSLKSVGAAHYSEEEALSLARSTVPSGCFIPPSLASCMREACGGRAPSRETNREAVGAWRGPERSGMA